MEDHSLVPLLRKPGAVWHHPAFTTTRHREHLGRSIRTERRHYAEWDAGASGAMLFS